MVWIRDRYRERVIEDGLAFMEGTSIWKPLSDCLLGTAQSLSDSRTSSTWFAATPVGTAQSLSGSRTSSTWFAATPVSSCTVPEGQRSSIRSTTDACPSPKCTRKSLCEM